MPETNVSVPLDPGRISVSVAEAAMACGVCARTISDAIRAGELPAARIGSRILILRTALVAWIESRSDTTGTKVRPDLSAALSARNRIYWANKKAKKEFSQV